MRLAVGAGWSWRPVASLWAMRVSWCGWQCVWAKGGVVPACLDEVADVSSCFILCLFCSSFVFFVYVFVFSFSSCFFFSAVAFVLLSMSF